ncbi:dephospho-CoA kinase [Chloroflexota bacterium]
MKIIGLTGGIGSGKSTVSQFLAEMGVVIIDADKVGHDVLKDTEMRREIVAAFGEQVLTPSGDIDRSQLGKIVFGDAELLSRLNQITHPRIHDMVEAQLEDYRQQGLSVVVLEAPLLVESAWVTVVNEVWVTVAPESTVLRRLQERSGLSEPDSLARIHSQLSVEERIKRADVVINTDCSLDELKMRVGELWLGLQIEGTGRPQPLS